MDCFCTILHYLNAMGFLHQGIRTVIPRYVLQLFAVAWFLQSVPCLDLVTRWSQVISDSQAGPMAMTMSLLPAIRP